MISAIPECSCTDHEICSWCAEYLPLDPVLYEVRRVEGWDAFK